MKEEATDVADDVLLERARSGDEYAFRTLVGRYESVVAATVTGMLGVGVEAEDVGQETFVRFYRGMHRFRGDAALATWLTRIAMNLSLNALRRRKRHARLTSRDAVPDGRTDPAVAPDDPALDAERRRRVRAALDTLVPEQRAVVVLRMMEERSTRETAEILGIREGTVMSRLARAMSKLEEALRPYMNDES
ncbi:MAG TPA: sigma-70 family RNA polymerase sigma factor [Longimicrobiales bacterium]|nr:sigma-70 family RNA polymerase sigma factor [Longimicrobiales bacterium]